MLTRSIKQTIKRIKKMEVKEVTIQCINIDEMKPEDVFKWLEQFSFKRHVLNHWLDPKKSEKFKEWMEDSTLPAQLFPCVIVPEHHHRKNIVIIEESMYQKIKAAFLKVATKTEETQ